MENIVNIEGQRFIALKKLLKCKKELDRINQKVCEAQKELSTIQKEYNQVEQDAGRVCGVSQMTREKYYKIENTILRAWWSADKIYVSVVEIEETYVS